MELLPHDARNKLPTPALGTILNVRWIKKQLHIQDGN